MTDATRAGLRDRDNVQMEPPRLTVCAIMSLGRAAHWVVRPSEYLRIGERRMQLMGDSRSALSRAE